MFSLKPREKADPIPWSSMEGFQYRELVTRCMKSRRDKEDGEPPQRLAATRQLLPILGLSRWPMVKNRPANAGDVGGRVRSLGKEDPLEKEMATSTNTTA